MHRYKDKLSQLASEFQKRFGIFAQLKAEFSLFRFPFQPMSAQSDAVKALLGVDGKLQCEQIDITCDEGLKEKFMATTLEEFYKILALSYPAFTMFASKILSMFGTTYLCEQAFSVMNITKSKYRSKLTQMHLNDVMTVSTTQVLVPDIDKLVKEKRCQVSSKK